MAIEERDVHGLAMGTVGAADVCEFAGLRSRDKIKACGQVPGGTTRSSVNAVDDVFFPVLLEEDGAGEVALIRFWKSYSRRLCFYSGSVQSWRR